MTSSPENKITRSDLVKSAVNVGALGMEFSWTYYKQMNIAFCLMVANMLKKIYAGRPDDYAEALHRHCAFFNITVQFAPFVGGIAMAMEEKVARGEIEPESVNDVKAALMGPLSGIGDSIFLSTLRVVAAAVGISLCQAGNPFGPIAFLLIYNVPGFALRIWGAVKGYELGVGFLDEAQRTGLMQKIMTCVGIVGVMVVGAMCKDMFWASIPVAIGSGEDAQTLQDILDGIMPGMLGMLAFWLYYWLLSKKINPMVLIVATMVVGIIVSLVRYFKVPYLAGILGAYVELARNTPLLIQLFFLYYAFPVIGWKMSAATCGIVGLIFLGGAYMAEGFSGGFNGVAKTQLESGRALGMSRWQLARYVVFPQGFALSVPALAANVIFLIKETSIFSVIAIPELTNTALDLIGLYYRSNEYLFVLVIAYAIILIPLSLILTWLERKVRYGTFGN